jgi:adenylate kinase
MSRGDLVPDELIVAMIIEALEGEDSSAGFILDGFPRTIEQAGALDSEMEKLGRSLTAVLMIDAPDEEIVRRLSGRRVCAKDSRHVYHVDFDPPKHEDVCDQCGARLVRRDDDDPEKVRHRLEVYHAQTEPLIAHYDERGLLRRFDGTRNATEVHDRIRAALATLRLEEKL